MKILSLFAFVLFSSTFVFAVSTSNIPFDGIYNIGVEGLIPNGELYTSETNAVLIEREIRNQISFLVGVFNGMGGTIDLAQTQIKIGNRNEQTGRLNYSAKIFISWSRNFQVPAGISFAVPLKANVEGIQDFYNRYSRSCSELTAGSELAASSFFYFYRPFNRLCPLRVSVNSLPNVTSLNIRLALSGTNTSGKFPEYGKIWEDGELTATIMVGTYEAGATSDRDMGIVQFNEIYQQLMRVFGKPVSMIPDLPPNAAPGMIYPDLEMNFSLQDGRKIRLNLLLIDKYQLQVGTSGFKIRVQELLENSDLFSYNGHSGLGSNIQALLSLGKYREGKYQVFYLNGCDTFSYVDNSLAEMHEKVNPGFGKYKFVDLITNSMPSPFRGFLQSNWALLEGLIGMRNNYYQILSQFDPYQRAVVVGEEDNQWPNPFN